MELDAGRTRELRVFSPDELREISLAAIGTVDEQMAVLDRALAGEDLDTASEAAHKGRNEALLVGARQLCDAFASLEHAARDGQLLAARQAAAQARELWPEARTAIAALADSDQDVTG